MYDVRPNTIIGFHGCDLDIRTKLINNPNQIEISKKPYDWLGHGMYFWENNYTRAMEWAETRANDGSFKTPARPPVAVFFIRLKGERHFPNCIGDISKKQADYRQ